MATPIDLDGVIGRLAAYRVLGTKVSGGECIQYIDGGFVGPYTAAFTVTNYVPSTGGSNGSAGGNASYGGDFYNFINNGGKAKQGCVVGVQGFCTGDQSFAIGVSGMATTFTPNIVSIGVTGVCGNYGSGGIQVGVYAGINAVADNGVEVKPESCALLVDNRSTGQPLILGRKNNGERLFELSSNGEIATSAPTGSKLAKIRLGISDSKQLILEINGEKFSVKLDKP